MWEPCHLFSGKRVFSSFPYISWVSGPNTSTPVGVTITCFNYLKKKKKSKIKEQGGKFEENQTPTKIINKMQCQKKNTHNVLKPHAKIVDNLFFFFYTNH